MKKSNYFFLFLLISILLLIFKNWIFSSEIIGGDWPYFYPENVHSFDFFPLSWSSVQANGLGGTAILYAINSYLYSTTWIFLHLFLSWEITYKIVWFGLFIGLGGYSSWKLVRIVFPEIPFPFQLISIFFYLTNTYILLVVGGGQMGVALAYAIAPLVLYYFIKVVTGLAISTSNIALFRLSLQTSLVVALQFVWDMRRVYIVLIAVLLLLLVNGGWMLKLGTKKKLLAIVYLFLPIVITLLLNAFWLVPLLFIGQNSVAQLGDAYTSIKAVIFFSFAQFENAFGLLHPNWPENIFGKVGFMKAEFLLVPLLAFSSLLFIKPIKTQKWEELYRRRNILFFSLLGLVGIFLAKGANAPFGQIYLWSFEHIPGFSMFRDPTKWYLLIILSYTVLLPFAIYNIYICIQKKKFLIKNSLFNFHNVFIFFIILFLLYLIRPALLGELSGTFKTTHVPHEYVKLKNTLVNDRNFYRTLWVPRMQRFAFTSDTHPAVEAASLFKATSSAEVVRALKKEKTKQQLSDLSVKYLIIPYDSEGEMFVKDRKYNNEERLKIEKELNRISWLRKVPGYGKITVYQLSSVKDHLYLLTKGQIHYSAISPIEYKVSIKSKTSNTLIFGESYDSQWQAKRGNTSIKNKEFNGLNSFNIPAGNTTIKISFELEKYYILGRIISVGTVILVIALMVFIYLLSKKEWHDILLKKGFYKKK